MSYNHTAYSGYKRDFFDMRNLLIESYRKYDKPLNWLIGRLDNWRFSAFTAQIRENPRFYQENSHLWRKDNSDLIGFVISENGKEYFELQVHPDQREIEHEMLQWVINDWSKGKKQIITNIYASDAERAERLERHGFERRGVVGVDYRYDTSKYVKKVDLSNDFRVEAFSESFDYENRIETERLTFGKDFLNREWFETKALAPGYSADWDLAIVASSGKVVAFCLAWLDGENRIAEIDPVGTHPDYRKRGFAKVLLTECFIRLKYHGVSKAQIIGFSEAAMKLYRSLMPVEEHELLEYRLRISGSARR
jgi:ribosomal protein S18 acetylase RimI-like enzyme